jgi:hypothetical protein
MRLKLIRGGQWGVSPTEYEKHRQYSDNTLQWDIDRGLIYTVKDRRNRMRSVMSSQVSIPDLIRDMGWTRQ